MAYDFLTPVDMHRNEFQNVVMHNNGTAPASPVKGQLWYDSTTDTLKWYNGSTWISASGAGAVTSVSGTAPIVSSGGTTPAISITAATTIAAGSMSSADKTKLDNATAANTGGTLILRDANGDYVARNITANSVLGLAAPSNGTDAANKTYVDNAANSKVSSVTGTAPIVSSGGTTPAISISAATTGLPGSMSAADKTKLDAATSVNTASTIVSRDASGDFAAHDITANRITGLATPGISTDAANKAYVDASVFGLDWKASVRAATTTNITLSGAQTIDGVSVIAGNRVLVKDQTTGADNGIYVASASAWARSADADASAEVTSGMAVFVEEGTVNADTGWTLTTNNPITLGTTALVFTQFTSLGQVTAGLGLTKTGNTLDVGAGTGISVAADSVGIDTALVVRKFSANIPGDGVDTTQQITHNLNTRDVVVEVYRNSTPWDTVICDVERDGVNTVMLTIVPAPANNEYRIVVHG